MNNKMRHRFRLLFLSVTALLLACVIIVLLIIRAQQRVEMAVRYEDLNLGYGQAAQTVIYTDAAFASGLCIGENDVGNAEIALPAGEHAGLYDIEDSEVLYAKGMYDRIYPASITKVMTAIVAFKYGNMDDMVTISWKDLELETGSQVAGLKIGDKVSMQDLMHGVLVHSGNDAAMAVARHVGGNVETFVDMMNAEAKELGATGTHFTSPTGLHDEQNYTTVYDIYLMMNEAIKYSQFVDMVQISVYDLKCVDKEDKERHITLDSTDHYLTGEAKPPKDVSVLGGKTGTTAAAGNCLAVVAQNAFGQPYIAVIMGAADKESLYRDMNILLAQINS
ncbi:MAG: D-alanyl-D-alanine carboxypeptidase [Lachnospiraceae bacterium]|nr:D-alanyl-D-alanine carboxypeptidase [Lachnospiraceae bacterium]